MRARRLGIFQRRSSDARDKSIYPEETHISARRERKGRRWKETAQLTTKSGRSLKFTSSRRARILLSLRGTSAFRSSSTVKNRETCGENPIDRSKRAAHSSFPWPKNTTGCSSAAERKPPGVRWTPEWTRVGISSEERTPPPFKRRRTTTANFVSPLSCSRVTWALASDPRPLIPRGAWESGTFSPPSYRRRGRCLADLSGVGGGLRTVKTQIPRDFDRESVIVPLARSATITLSCGTSVGCKFYVDVRRHRVTLGD